MTAGENAGRIESGWIYGKSIDSDYDQADDGRRVKNLNNRAEPKWRSSMDSKTIDKQEMAACHTKAAEHHTKAAEHHTKAAEHHKAGNHEKASAAAHLAHGHACSAKEHTAKSAKHCAGIPRDKDHA